MIGSPDSSYVSSAMRSVVARPRGSLHALTSFRPGSNPTLLRKILVVAARLRRLANDRVATSIARRALQASLFVQHQPERSRLDRNGTLVRADPAKFSLE
jgi:hypothetical protein